MCIYIYIYMARSGYVCLSGCKKLRCLHRNVLTELTVTTKPSACMFLHLETGSRLLTLIAAVGCRSRGAGSETQAAAKTHGSSASSGMDRRRRSRKKAAEKSASPVKPGPGPQPGWRPRARRRRRAGWCRRRSSAADVAGRHGAIASLLIGPPRPPRHAAADCSEREQGRQASILYYVYV